MYEAHFRLKEKPFSISPDPRFIYLTAQHQEALAKVQYAISQRMGVSAIYGDIGAGKTSLARRLWVLYADDPTYNFAMMVHPNGTDVDSNDCLFSILEMVRGLRCLRLDR